MSQTIYIAYPDLKGHGIPYCRVHLNRLIDAGQFPQPVELSANRIAWRLSDIEEWKETRPPATRRPRSKRAPAS